MANQTVTTTVNYDDASISGLLNGETLTLNGGSVTIDADVRWNQQAAVFGSVSISASLGGSFLIDGTQIWEVPFSASSGNVPTQNARGSNGVTGGTSGATGELTRVWASNSRTPATAGTAMPNTGYIKLRSRTGTFQNGEIITLPGGATITASGAGQRSWLHAVGTENTTLTLPRLGTFSVNGDWYNLGVTDGTDNQTFQFPVLDECPAVQVETAPGSNVYEWWTNAGHRWINNANMDDLVPSGTTQTPNNISGPQGALVGGQYLNGARLRETATSAPHSAGVSFTANQIPTGILTYRAWIRKETRRWMLVQAASGSNRFGALVDLDAGTIIANPTIGTPTNTSSNITSAGGGWFLVELTLNHTVTNTAALNVCLAASSTPTYDANGLPTYLGVTTEGGYVGPAHVLHPTTQQIATDARGKYFFSDSTTGVLTFAKRDANYNAGQKPASGCRVRIPNVILSSSTSADWTRDVLNETPTSRYEIDTTSGGSINVRYACCAWYLVSSAGTSMTLRDSAVSVGIVLTNIAGSVSITNCACLGVKSGGLTSLAITSSYSGSNITDSVFVRFVAGTTAVVNLSTCKNVTFSNCRFDSFPTTRIAPTKLSVVTTVTTTSSDTITFTNCACVGGMINSTTTNTLTITNLQYADVMVGNTPVLNGTYAVSLTTVKGCVVDGLSAYAQLTNVHPYEALFASVTSCDTITIQNIGSAATPYDGGTANLLGIIYRFTSTTTNITLRRIYVQNLRTATFSSTNTIQNARFYNVWGDGADSQVNLIVDCIAQGCRWTNPSTTQTGVYGTHWEDAFVSETDGRLMISGCEPIATTNAQCSGTFGLNAGFTSTGSIALPNLEDSVEWTMPYAALGHTSLARFTSGVTTNPWSVTGTNTQFLEFQYQINTGAGFSAWKHLLNQGRRASGGGSGTNTVTLNSSERAAMLRQPQVGDYIQTASQRLPLGTTITNVSGDTLTVSNAFTANMTSNELIFIWRDIVDETISPSIGYTLKVRVRVNTASSTTLFSFLRIPFDTTAIAQQTQYPLPQPVATASVTGIIANSRFQIYNVTANTEVINQSIANTSWSLNYTEGTTFTSGDVIRIRIRQPGYLPYQAQAIAANTGWSLLASQQADPIYTASTPANYSIDYGNFKIRATGDRASFTAQEIVDIIRVSEATANGIALATFADISGEVELSPGVFTAITVNLLGWQLSWAANSVSQASISNGNIVGGINGDPVEDVVGGPQVTVRVSADATIVTPTASISPADITAIAAAVLSAAQTTPIASDIREVNGYVIDGAGTTVDPWGPV